MGNTMDKSTRQRPLVLIVDDTPTNIQVLAHALRHRYAIKIATSGPAALALLEQDGPPPDLVLLDVMMPDMDGHEVCRRLKENPKTQPIPVIFVTAMSDSEDQQRGFDLGAVDYITKPFVIPLVLARVAIHIRLKLQAERLEKLAMIDGLTDVPNRRALDDTLAREIARANRSGSPLSLLMIDIDNFKAYNDHYGHGAGDECLRTVAQAIGGSLLRPGDFLGRYGGEEFAAILPDCDAPGALSVAEKLRESVAGLRIPHRHSDAAEHVTVSIGCATRKPMAKEAGAVTVADADQALYAAKARGRNRVVSSSPA